jgi:hypothetical protein
MVGFQREASLRGVDFAAGASLFYFLMVTIVDGFFVSIWG